MPTAGVTNPLAPPAAAWPAPAEQMRQRGEPRAAGGGQSPGISVKCHICWLPSRAWVEMHFTERTMLGGDGQADVSDIRLFPCPPQRPAKPLQRVSNAF